MAAYGEDVVFDADKGFGTPTIKVLNIDFSIELPDPDDLMLSIGGFCKGL